MPKKSSVSRTGNPLSYIGGPAGPQGQLCAAWEDEKLGPALLRASEGILACAETFLQCRKYEKNFFIGAVLQARKDFYNAGLSIKPATANAKTAAWLADRKNVQRVRKFVGDAWREYLLMDCMVAFWRQGSTRATMMLPEEVVFKDRFGVETLQVTHNLSAKEIENFEGFSKVEKDVLARNRTVTLWHPDEAPADTERNPNPMARLSQYWFFEVLKKEKTGYGLGVPGLANVFQALSQNEAMEVGDNLWAQVGRKVYEEHTIGHEIKAGQLAGSDRHFLKAKRKDAIEKGVKGKSGAVVVVKNFDHVISFNRPDPKSFDAKKYEAVVNRLLWWAMPIGHMILSKGLSPYLMDILKVSAREARADMGMHLESVIPEAFAIPGPIRITWDNKVFKDSRLALDILKTGLASGPISQQTFMEDGGFDPAEERARKAEEAALPEGVTHPTYDMHHGPPKEMAGRKRGSPNKK